MNKWIKAEDTLPDCPKDKNALGIPVLIWPRNNSKKSDLLGSLYDGFCDGFAYFGRRATGKPAFYLHGATLNFVTHWRHLPEGPDDLE